MPFYVPWTEPKGADLERAFMQYHWLNRANLSPDSWSLDLGVWDEGRFVGVQGVSTHDFPGDPHRRDRLVARPAVPRPRDSGR